MQQLGDWEIYVYMRLSVTSEKVISGSWCNLYMYR